MRKFSVLIGLFLAFFAVQGWAGDHSVSLVWDHNLPTDLAKFELRVNGDNDTLVEIAPDVLEWFGVLAVNDDNNVFDMRACDLSGQCSIWSEPCNYDPEPLPPTLKCGELIIDASADGDSVDIHIRWAAQRK
jgi:hypothetical protein